MNQAIIPSQALKPKITDKMAKKAAISKVFASAFICYEFSLNVSIKICLFIVNKNIVNAVE